MELECGVRAELADLICGDSVAVFIYVLSRLYDGDDFELF